MTDKQFYIRLGMVLIYTSALGILTALWIVSKL